MKKNIHWLSIIPIVSSTIVPISACSTNKTNADIVNKDIEAEVAYEQEAKFIFKLNKEVSNDNRFEVVISNLKVVDRFNQIVTYPDDVVFNVDYLLSSDNKLLTLTFFIAQKRAIYAGCVATFDINLKCYKDQDELWNQEFHNYL